MFFQVSYAYLGKDFQQLSPMEIIIIPSASAMFFCRNSSQQRITLLSLRNIGFHEQPIFRSQLGEGDMCNVALSNCP
jgi:hypothetical protein